MAIGRARFAAVTDVKPTFTRLDRQQRLLAVGLVLGVTMVAFEITAVLTTLPTITDQLHGDSLYGVALAGIEPDELTPRQALEALYRLKSLA